jgi:DNA-binding transcriptional LysR family regulator
MDTLRGMRALVRTADLENLSAAARSLGTTQPTVSKLLTALEHQAGVRLLERSSVRVRLTIEGRRFLETSRRILEEYDEAITELHSMRLHARGTVRFAAPIALGQARLNALMPAFLEQYPGVSVELILEDRFVDLVEERIDVALRVGGEPAANLTARYVACWPRYLVAAPNYLHRCGVPLHPKDLTAHSYLRYSGELEDDLHLTGPDGPIIVPMISRYRVNSAIALLESVERGMGIALQPQWMVDDLIGRGSIVRVLPNWTGPSQVAHLVVQARHRQPARVAALLDYLVLEMPKL